MAGMSKAEYLKKYMSDDSTSEKKKKKRKKANTLTGRSRIIDDDVDFKLLLPANLENPLEEDVGDNDPTVAEFIDERPKHIQELEQYRQSGQWRVMGQKHQQEEFILEFGEVKDEGSPARKRRHDSDSDTSPLRPSNPQDSGAALGRKAALGSNPGAPRAATGKRRHNSDSDTSPPRGNSGKRARDSPQRLPSGKPRQRQDSDSDPSPSRKRHAVRETDSPARRGERERNGQSRGRHDSDSDTSPPRKGRGSGRDPSSPRRARHDSDSDTSPPRKNSSQAPSASASSRQPRGRHDSSSGSDASPPRRKPPLPQKHPAVSRQQRNSDSGTSPPRRGRRQDDDASPPRRGSRKVPAGSARHQDSDGDLSPPRPSASRERRNSDSSPPRRSGGGGEMKKATKTLGGAKAGLSSSKEMKAEMEKLKRAEEEELRKIGAERLGAGSQTVFRDKSGRRRDLAAEAEQQKLEEAEKAKQQAKFQAWGKGLKQQAEREQTLEDHLHEAAKPLARYQDDEDLDAMLRAREREGDPMAAYMRKKKAKAGGATGSAPERPRYSGPAAPPNRFGIQPGYRWDGVDRSSGFEKQLFAKQAEKKAVKEMAYKWSVEDM